MSEIPEGAYPSGHPYGQPHFGNTQSFPAGQGGHEGTYYGADSRVFDPSSRVNPDDERTWAVVAHLTGLIATVFSVGILGFVGPFIIWAIYKDKSPYIRRASARSFNFYLFMFVAAVCGGVIAGILTIICFVLMMVPPVGMLFTVLALLIAGIATLAYFILIIVCPIRAALAASRGGEGTYPFSLHVLQ